MRNLVSVVRLYILKKDYKKALMHARELQRTAQETNARQYIRDCNHLLWMIYKLNDRDSAYKYLVNYATIKDSMDIDQSFKKLTFFKVATEDQKKKDQIVALNRENLIGQQQLKIQQQRLKNESLFRNILIVGILTTLLTGIFIFRNTSLKRKNEKLQNERIKFEMQQRASELEMQVLRAQMNPHFIFNSLNSINRFILQNDKLQASEYLTKFSKLVRMILQHSQAILVPLENELDCLRLYLELEALRFDHRFSFKISVAPEIDIEVVKVPPLIIQPYAENAIWHGLMHKEEKGQLDIEIFQENDSLYLKISDNGIGRQQATAIASKSATKHKSMGLRITANRIAMQSSNGYQSEVTINDLLYPDGNAAGTEVLIKMPVIYQ